MMTRARLKKPDEPSPWTNRNVSNMAKLFDAMMTKPAKPNTNRQGTIILRRP